MNRKLFALCLVLVLALGLFAGCTDKPAESTTNAPTTNAPGTDAPKTEAPATEAPATEAPATQPAETQLAATDAPATGKVEGDPKTIAANLIGSPVEDLYAAIGEPEGSSYASSCDGPGEDGELYYEGFTVYTYREDGKETVKDVY